MPRPKRARQAAKPAQQQQETDPQTEGRQTRRTRSMNTRTSAAEHQALQSATHTRDAALDRLANEDVTTTATSASTGEDDTLESVEVGRRATTPQRRDTTGLDLGEDIFGDLDDSFENIKVPGSGRSWDNSSVYGGGSSHMKPRSRSRQSSIIGRNDPPIRPSSRNGNTPLMSSSFNIGAFRRRAREPSILGTAQKNSSRADLTATTLNAHESDLEGGEEMEMGDFAPEAESTPVNNRRRSRRSIHQQQQQQQQQQERETSPSLPELSVARKRKSDVAAESSDRPEKALRTEEDDIPQLDISSDSESESDLSSPAAPPARSLRPRVTNERPVTPNQGDFAAPPASSGSESEGEFWPDIRGLARRRRRPSVHEAPQTDALSDVSSPPSLTHSPNFGGKSTKGRGRSRTRREVSPPPLTTAYLANLLPKRRHKGPRQDVEVEYDTSGLAQDQDELSFARSTRKRTGSRATSTRSASRAAAASKAPAEKTTDAGTKQTAPGGRVTRSSRRNAKTYSRRLSDKENNSDAESDVEEIEESMFEPHVDETFDASAPDSFVVTEELKAARRKFEEVDKYEMSFEEEEDEEAMAEAR